LILPVTAGLSITAASPDKRVWFIPNDPFA
jgi:hypothetical protein